MNFDFFQGMPIVDDNAVTSGQTLAGKTFDAIPDIADKRTYCVGVLIKLAASLTQTSGTDTITVAEQADFIKSLSYKDAMDSVCEAITGRQLDNILEPAGILTNERMAQPVKYGSTLSGTDAIAYESSWLLPFAPGFFLSSNPSIDDLVGARPAHVVKDTGSISLTVISDSQLDGNFALTSGTKWTVTIVPLMVACDEIIVSHRTKLHAISKAASELSVNLPGDDFRTILAAKVTAADYSAFAEPADPVVTIDGVARTHLCPGDDVNCALGWVSPNPAIKNMDDGQVVFANPQAPLQGHPAGRKFAFKNIHKEDAVAAQYLVLEVRAPSAQELANDLAGWGVAAGVAGDIVSEYVNVVPPQGKPSRLSIASGVPAYALPGANKAQGGEKALLVINER